MLRPDVAECFELTSHTRLVHVPRLGRTVDLTRISVEEAEQLLALPGSFEWLRRKEPAAPELPVNDVGPALENAGPTRAKKKRA
jgi:hypothetical protein